MNFGFEHIVELMVAVMTFWGIMWNFRREDKKDRVAIREKAEETTEKRHQETGRRLETIESNQETMMVKRKFLPGMEHEHAYPKNATPDTPLTIGGLRFPPENGE